MMQGYTWTASCRSVVAAGEATVPFAVPGVLFGETLFETLRARRGTLFRLADHVRRLQRGIEALGWGTPVSMVVIKEGLRALLQTGSLAREHNVRVRMTAVRLDDSGALEYFIQAVPYTPPSLEQYKAGVEAIITSLQVDATAPWANFKTGHRLPHRLAKAEAERAGAWEGILLNTDGMLADGTIANVHFVVAGCIFTPSHRCGALPGIAQRVVREIAAQENIPWEFGAYSPALLRQATEAFFTNALIGVMPLVRIDGQPIGDGMPGPVTRQLATEYAARVARDSVRVICD